MVILGGIGHDLKRNIDSMQITASSWGDELFNETYERREHDNGWTAAKFVASKKKNYSS